MYGYIDLAPVRDGSNCRSCGMRRSDCEFVDDGEDPALARCCDSCTHLDHLSALPAGAVCTVHDDLEQGCLDCAVAQEHLPEVSSE